MNTMNMTTLPPNYIRLSSKWLETNPLPEDGVVETMNCWAESEYRGQPVPYVYLKRNQYATARTDLPREAYMDSEPGAEVASERAELDEWKEAHRGIILAVLRGLGRPSQEIAVMNQERIEKDIATLRAQLEAEQAKRKDTARDFETAFRLVREENDKLRAELQQAREGRAAQESELTKALAAYEDQVQSLEAERDKLRAEVKELKGWKASAIAVWPPIQEIGNALGLRLGVSVHDKILPGILRLTAELDAKNRRIKEVGTDLAGYKTELDAVRKKLASHVGANKYIAERADAAQVRCGELERGLNTIRETFKVVGNIGRIERIIDSLLTPSQQPDNLEGGDEPCAPQVINCNAPVVGRDQVQMITTQQDAQSTESASNPQPESPIPSGVGQPSRPEPVKAGEWRRIDDRDPRSIPDKQWCYVLVACEGGNVAESLFVSDLAMFPYDKIPGRKSVGKYGRHFEITQRGYKVTHWMHKPAPPIAPEGKATEDKL